MKYAIPFKKIPPEYWLFNELYYQEEYMAFRKRMSKGSSKKTFRKGMGIKTKNLQQAPQRGGYRL